MENTKGYIKTTIIPIKQTVVFMKNNVVRYLETLTLDTTAVN